MPSPFPPFGESLGAGLRAVGSSPLLLATGFISLLATWAVLTLLGTRPELRILSVSMAAPPLHVFFDAQVALPIGGSQVQLLGVTAALAATRALTFGVILHLLVGHLRGERPALRASFPTLPKTVLSLFAVYVAELALLVAGSWLIASLLGGTFTVLVAVVGVHFLSFVAVVIAAEGVPARPALSRGVRAARLPGGRHLIMVMVYFVFALYLVSGVPPLTPVTPSILGWAFALGATVLHLGVLGALVYRWLAVRDHPRVVAPAAAGSPTRSGDGGQRPRRTRR